MSPMLKIALLVLQTVGGLYVLILTLRFLLHTARADYYNPISQAIAKLTNKPLLPLRRFVPGMGGLDMANLLLAYIVQFATVYLSCLLFGMTNPLTALMWAGLGLVSMICYIYFIAMIVMIIVSFIAPQSRHPLVVLAIQLVQPICAPIQRILPSMGGLDFSPILVFLALNIVRILIESAAVSVGAVGQAAQLIPGLM